MAPVEIDLDLESLTSLNGVRHNKLDRWLLVHVELEFSLVSVFTLSGLDGNSNSLEVNFSEVSRWNLEGVSVEIDTLKEFIDVVDTLSDRPLPFELTSHGLVPGGFEFKVLHRILETGVEFFSSLVSGLTESRSFESISILITR